MKPLEFSRTIDCRSAVEPLWEALSDTDRLNRAVGLSKVEVAQTLEKSGAARFLLRTSIGGFDLEFEERPFEFLRNRHFSIRRVQRKGPAAAVDLGFGFFPEGDKTKVSVRVQLEPRSAVWVPVLKLNGARSIESFAKAVERVDRELTQAGCVTDARTSHADEARVARAAELLLRELPPSRRALGEQLLSFVREAPDVAVARIRPFELADQWRADERAVLATCLQATTTGLLELSWDLICPSCRGGTGSVQQLSSLPDAGHCPLCDLSWGLELDKLVEATFKPPAAIRLVDSGPYCISGPARMPHVLAQAILPPGGSAQLEVSGKAGRMRVFARGGAVASVNAAAGGPTRAQLTLSGGRLTPAAIEIGPSGVIEVTDAANEETHVKLERSEWINRAATAAIVSTMPEFRRLFSGDVLRPGLGLSVGRVSLLFSDLSGSTALYARLGDARAFRLVQEHFDLLRRVVEDHAGTLVKTIGDAVMAAFVSETEAVRAALEMQRAWSPFRQRFDDAHQTSLKIGVYAGPCFAVTANGVLDYFGQTVNIAARLQGQAEAGEIIMTEELFAHAREARLFDARVKELERYAAELKGVEGTVPCVRLGGFLTSGSAGNP